MRFVAAGVVLVASSCGRTGFPAQQFADAAGQGETLAPDTDYPGYSSSFGGAGPEAEAEEGAFVPVPDLPMDTPPDPSCGNGVIDAGELCYVPRVGYPARIDPCGVAIADFNEDGHLDVVVPNSDFDHVESPENFVSVLLGDGAGHLGEPVQFAAGGDYAVSVSVGDLDNDGRLDLLVTNSDVAAVSVLRGGGGAQFFAPSPHAVGAGPVTTGLADIDHDGDLDFAATAAGSNQIHVALGIGNGSFAPAAAYPTTGSPWEIVLADLDGDTHVDMTATNGGAELFFWRGLGDGGFEPGGALPVDASPLGLVAVDLDHNGTLELVSANYAGSSVMAYRNDGGSMTQMQSVPLGLGPRSLAPGDFDMDGHTDVVVSDDVLLVVHVVLGNGKSGLEPAAHYGTGLQPSVVRVGDLNEDGVLDLVTSDQLSNEVGVILSNP